MISVIIPYHNRDDFIQQSLDSIYSQNFTDFEIIIINDFSSKQSREQLEKIVGKYDNRIKIYDNNRQVGPGLSFYKGIKFSRGLLIARLDSDDFWTAGSLKRRYSYLINNPKVDFVSSEITSDIKYVFENKDYLHETNIAFSLLKNNTLNTSTILFRRKIIDIFSIQNNFTYAEDYRFWIELIGRYRVDRLNSVDAFYRIHENQLTNLVDMSSISREVEEIRLLATKKFFKNKKYALKIFLKNPFFLIHHFSQMLILTFSKIFCR